MGQDSEGTFGAYARNFINDHVKQVLELPGVKTEQLLGIFPIDGTNVELRFFPIAGEFFGSGYGDVDFITHALDIQDDAGWRGFRYDSFKCSDHCFFNPSTSSMS